MKQTLVAFALLGVAGCATQFKGEPGTGLGGGSGDDGGSGGAGSSEGGTSSGSGSSGGGQQSSGSSGSVSASGSGGGSSGGSGSGGEGGIGSGGSSSGDGGKGTPACPATSTLKAGNTNGTINFGGTTRQYIAHVPPGYTGKTAVPLVLDYHGILLDYNYELAQSGYASKADQEGFIVVFPNGIDQAWNVGPCCTTSRTVDDVGFSRAVIAQIEGQACIDPKRIYAVGYSMGGGMAMKMACDAADIIAAIAPSAFDLMAASNGWTCSPSRPITEITFRSTGDPIVPYNGGPTNPPNGLPVVVNFLGAVATLHQWAQLDQCTGSAANNTSLQPQAGTTCQTYGSCGHGVQATLCTKQGGGHDFGDPNVAWSMLSKYTLP